MIEVPQLLRNPLSDVAFAALKRLVERRRAGAIEPPTVQELADELETLAPAVRAAAEELHDRRLAVVEDPGTLAPVRWPRLASLAGRLRMNIADQLAEAGADVDDGIATAWAEADDEARPPEDAEPSAEGPAHHVWQAMVAAHHGQVAEALEHCRHAAAGTVTVGVVPMLARLAGWLDRLAITLRMPTARFLKFVPRLSANERARLLFEQGWQAELVRNRKRAAQAYVAALREDPAFDWARIRYAAALFHEGQIAKALEEMERLAAARPHVAAAHLAACEILLALAEDGKAPPQWAERVRKHAEAVAEARGDVAWASVLLSRALGLAGHPEAAAEQARRAIALEPGLAHAYHALATALTSAGELVDAAWAEACALLADAEMQPAAEALFSLRQSPQVAAAVPHPRQFMEDAWQ